MESTIFIDHIDRRDNNGEKYESANIDEITRHRAYNQGNPTTLYIHGYKESQDSDTVNMIARAYAKRGNNNLIVLDWAVGASGPLYPMAVRQAYRVSNQTHSQCEEFSWKRKIAFRLVASWVICCWMSSTMDIWRGRICTSSDILWAHKWLGLSAEPW